MSDTPHIMIIEAAPDTDVGAGLASGAIAVLDKAGATCERYPVPGVLDIPAALRIAIKAMDFQSGLHRFDGYIALGCVAGERSLQAEIAVQECVRGLQDLALEYTLAVGSAILTPKTDADALPVSTQQGEAAAAECLAMIDHKRKFRLFPRT
jgi:6,7-dimethyl-8-ribityllumazine synthase